MFGPNYSLVLYDTNFQILWISDLPPPHAIDAMLGRHPWEFVSAPDVDRFQAAMIRCLAGEGPQMLDVRVAPDGQWWRNSLYLLPALPVVRLLGVAYPCPVGFEQLTDREREICQLFAEGFAGKEVARKVGCSRSTIANHRFHIAHKIGVPPPALAAWCGANRDLLCGHFPK